MTREEKADLARRNGAKSQGPVTPEGKLRSSRNSLTYGRRASNLKFFIPPHDACASTESRQAFYNLLDILVAHYRPFSEVGYNIVREIGIATWQIQRLTATQTLFIDRELARLNGTPLPAADPLYHATAATESLFGDKFITPRLTREIDRLHRRITQLERRYVFNRSRFSSSGNKVVKLAQLERDEETRCNRTEEISLQPTENTENGFANEKIDPAA